MIRLLTQSLGGQAYLNFMGNEFGHPEWIDFPREGNNFSYHYCRRQWNLVDDKNLLFQCLNNFDREMNKWERVFQVMESEDLYVTSKHEEDKVIIFEKGKLLFAFNFNPTKSFENYRIGTQWASDHVILYETDSKEFGGNCRLDQGKKNRFVPTKGLWQHRKNSIRIYLPNRTAIVFVAEENITEQALQNGVFIPATIEAHA
jgi:1,4-alpha-glucan branching enzyme